ncbi:hypothetical protein GBA63_04450 [Rubrobacter tropicus]|uniref:Uncharacterized protein n=1 Tax=Rubrobacter tropicus TaxID=2653851 RepID=A0A6G8QEV1_9ACTN|nr:hypothetical protein GBA63_04450 [Rubrobacter tropicus]
MQPVEGSNTHKEFPNERGEGLYRPGHVVEDIDEAIRRMEEKRFSLLRSGPARVRRRVGEDHPRRRRRFRRDGSRGPATARPRPTPDRSGSRATSAPAQDLPPAASPRTS